MAEATSAPVAERRSTARIGEHVSADADRLDAIATEIRDLHERVGRLRRAAIHADLSAIDARLAIGHLLIEARERLASDNAYGAWFRDQRLGFTTEWARRLRLAAEHEEQVRAVIARNQLRAGRRPSLGRALAEVLGERPLTWKEYWRVVEGASVGITDDDVGRLVRGFIDSGISLGEVEPERLADWWLHTVMNGGPPLERRLDRDDAMERLRESVRWSREFADRLAALVARLEPAAGMRQRPLFGQRDLYLARTREEWERYGP